VAIKEQTLPALASTVITAKYKGKVNKDITYIASIFSPKTPTVSGMPAVVSIDKNNNCKIIVDNCAPYDVIIDRNDVLGFMDIETDELIPMEDSTIAAILNDIDKHLPKVPKKKLTKTDIAAMCQMNTKTAMWTYFINTKKQSVLINTTSALPHITNIKYT
jgi:hypothetical protein